MTVFDTRVAGIPCQCEVTYYAPPREMRVTGTGYGDADPPEPEEFEFSLLTTHGDPAPWLETKLTPNDHHRLKAEYLS